MTKGHAEHWTARSQQRYTITPEQLEELLCDVSDARKREIADTIRRQQERVPRYNDIVGDAHAEGAASAMLVLYQLEADIRSIIEVDDSNKAYRNMIIEMIKKMRKKIVHQQERV